MNVLYHGTRYLDLIIARQSLRPSSIGEKNISLTTKKYVAKYWAEMWRDDTIGFGHIIVLDRNMLENDGFELTPFVSDHALFAEYEVVSSRPIAPVLRYIVKIERVIDSFLASEEKALIRSQPVMPPQKLIGTKLRQQ